MWKRAAGLALITVVVATGCSAEATDAAAAPSSSAVTTQLTGQNGHGPNGNGAGQGNQASQSGSQQGNGPGDCTGPMSGQQNCTGTSQGPGGPGNGGPGQGGPGQGAGMQVPTVGTLTATEAELLTFGREEERMAHDLYVAFDEKYDLQVFSNISASETQHFEVLGDALSQAGLPDPAAGSTPGVFADQTIQGLYDDWYDQGQQSAKAAVEAAIELEKRDIADLESAIAQTQDAGLKQIFENLKSASENHLNAFEKVLGTM